MVVHRLNPDSVTLADVQKMTLREFRTYSFLKLNHIDDNVHNLDTRLWGVLVGVIITVATVIGSAVL